MNKCPITYQDCEGKYSIQGLRQLSYGLRELHDLPYSAEEQRYEAGARAAKMSIQGVQPKLSAALNIKEAVFNIVDINGTYIIKPQSHLYKELPQNEDLTMKIAGLAGIEVPRHGMIYGKDGSLSYFIKRFDRYKQGKVPLEDFAQLSGATRETKYNSSMEQAALTIDTFCTFPLIEKLKLFRLAVFSFIFGNEDLHLKNLSLITRQGKVELSPAYDLVNTSIVLKDPEELALPINGRRKKLKKNDFMDYYGNGRLGLNQGSMDAVLRAIFIKKDAINSLIDRSFLSPEYREKYRDLFRSRAQTFQ